jgi:hypothetical protein
LDGDEGSALAASGRRGVALEGVSIAPGVGVDVGAVAVLGKAIDEGTDAAAPGKVVAHC